MILLVLALGFVHADHCTQWYLRYNTLYECLDDHAKLSTRSSLITPETTKAVTTTTTMVTSTTTMVTSTTTAVTTTSDTLETIQSPTVSSVDLTTKEISQEPKFENTTSAAPRQRWWMSPFGIIGLM